MPTRYGKKVVDIRVAGAKLSVEYLLFVVFRSRVFLLCLQPNIQDSIEREASLQWGSPQNSALSVFPV